MTFFLAPERGSPLRSMTRTDMVGKLRLPDDAPGGLWANEPYLAGLLAAGPALHVREVLYLRWDQRTGGLTDGWKDLRPDQVVQGYKANIARMVRLMDEVAPTAAEQEALVYALMLPRLAEIQRAANQVLFARPQDIHPAFKIEPAPAWLTNQTGEMGEWVRRRLAEARAVEMEIFPGVQ